MPNGNCNLLGTVLFIRHQLTDTTYFECSLYEFLLFVIIVASVKKGAVWYAFQLFCWLLLIPNGREKVWSLYAFDHLIETIFRC